MSSPAAATWLLLGADLGSKFCILVLLRTHATHALRNACTSRCTSRWALCRSVMDGAQCTCSRSGSRSVKTKLAQKKMDIKLQSGG
eukprot:m.351225 g.351225  ORF g.351225 m.351225 type:complete len:86 (-) comp27974_c0_seq30:28-285(-)